MRTRSLVPAATTSPRRPPGSVPPRAGRSALRSLVALLIVAVAAGCQPADGGPAGEGDGTAGEATAPAQPSPLASECAPDDGGITLPDGFCAIVAREGGGRLRHVDVREDGTVLAAVPPARRSGDLGGVLSLRDEDGDGVFEVSERWGERGGNEVLLDGEDVYVAPDDAVHRYHLPTGSLVPDAGPEVVVSTLPADRSHRAKSVALGPDGSMYVNIGAPSNACQQEAREEGSPGMDPCPQLETRGGIWRFDADGAGQTQADGSRFATGLRNVVALRTHPGTGQLYGVQHGRDQLHGLFPDMYTVEESAELPSEEFVAIDGGDDFGWPYCYHDWQQGKKLLAPEYGGDKTTVGRCAEAEEPLIGFPGHWAPNDLEFYTGEQFPAQYRGGAFIAFHGSWNRAPLPQDGYNVVFVPFQDGDPTGEWEIFADGFRPEPGSTEGEGEGRPGYRPVGLAMGPDGSLYISDSSRGRIWRVVYRGM